MIFTVNHPDALILSALVGAVGILALEHLGLPALKWVTRKTINLVVDLALAREWVDPVDRAWRNRVR